jgi:penicillin amidase
VDPPNHFVNTSNNLIVSYDFPHYVAPAGAPFRAQRIVDMLTERAPFTIAKFAEMHADNMTIPGKRMAQRVRDVQPSTDLARQARDVLANWDGYHRADDAAGAVYETLRWKLYDSTLGRLRGLMADPKPSDDSLRVHMWAIQALAQADDAELLAHDAFSHDNWDAMLAEALDATAEHLSSTLGADPAAWSWGALHTINFRHGIGREEPMASLLNAGAYPFGGAGDTVNNANHGGGPSFRATSVPTYRQIIDLGNFSNSVFIIPPGQSGHVASPHYADHLEDYQAVRYRPLLWEWDRIEREKESEQTLEPEG